MTKRAVGQGLFLLVLVGGMMALLALQADPSTALAPSLVQWLPLVLIGGWVVVAMLARLKAARVPKPDTLRLGHLADSMGLRVAQGNPSESLAPQGSASEARLEGEVRGVPLLFAYRQARSTDFFGDSEASFECRLDGTGAQAFPRFEVLDRATQVEPSLGLPEMPTGRASVDKKYRVFTRQPALAKLLGEELPAFDAVSDAGLQLQGDGTRVSAIFRHDQRPFVSEALVHAGTLSSSLAGLTRAVGG
jgi:hypothetical protein